jgi:hypothetical protein
MLLKNVPPQYLEPPPASERRREDGLEEYRYQSPLRMRLGPDLRFALLVSL